MTNCFHLMVYFLYVYIFFIQSAFFFLLFLLLLYLLKWRQRATSNSNKKWPRTLYLFLLFSRTHGMDCLAHRYGSHEPHKSSLRYADVRAFFFCCYLVFNAVIPFFCASQTNLFFISANWKYGITSCIKNDKLVCKLRRRHNNTTNPQMLMEFILFFSFAFLLIFLAKDMSHYFARYVLGEMARRAGGHEFLNV